MASPSSSPSDVSALAADLDALRAEVASLHLAATAMEAAFPINWVMVTSILIFMMQVGFAMLEAGAVRAKNTTNILLKNLIDTCTAALAFWLVGYDLAYGDGSSPFAATLGHPVHAQSTVGQREEAEQPLWFQQFVFAATASTIVSGALAERTRPIAYMMHTAVMVALIYPVVVHWFWGPAGWLSPGNDKAFLDGAIDIAGGGVVHLTGGTVALVGARVIGPRTGRFNELTGAPMSLPGQSTIQLVLGVFMLWTAWLAFNAGSVGGLEATQSNDPERLSRTLTCTMLSGATGGLTALLVEGYNGKVSTAQRAVNGILAGLVSITAGCAVVTSYAACLIGAVGGVTVYATSHFVLHRAKIDDPVDAFAVHGACGCWSLLATALFATPDFSNARSAGVFYGGGAKLLAAAALAIVAIASWSASVSLSVFGILMKARFLRIGSEAELTGLDIAGHGGSAYGLDPTDAPPREYPPVYSSAPPDVPLALPAFTPDAPPPAVAPPHPQPASLVVSVSPSHHQSSSMALRPPSLPELELTSSTHGHTLIDRV